MDDVYAFFQNCYHLKDWLKKDPAFKAPEDIEKFVEKTLCLALCADICNATKHLGLDTRKKGKGPRSGHESKVAKREYKVGFGAEGDSMSCQVTVEHNGKNVDAYTLATECLKEWEEFVKRACGPCGCVSECEPRTRHP